MVNGNPVSWSSHKQSVVALSSTEAEYIALASAAKEALWLRKLMDELEYKQHAPIDICVDNTSAIKLANNPELHSRTKHIDTRFHFSRNLVQEGKIQVPYVATENQLADIFTKPLLKNKHGEMKMKLGLKEQGRNVASSCDAGRNIISSCVAIMTLLSVCMQATGFHLQNSVPILWRQSSTPVVAGSNQVFLRVRLVNPCPIFLSQAVLYINGTDEALQRCNDMYHEYVIHELEAMCPKDETMYIMRRSKRAIPFLIIGAIAASVVLWAGAGTAFGLSIHNKGTLSDMKEVQRQQEMQIKELESRVNMTEYAIRNLQLGFNSLVDVVEQNTNDIAEIKGKQIGLTYAISYLTSRFILARHVIKESTRKWKQGNLNSGLMDFLNLTLPCGEDCPYSLAKTKKCFFHQDLKDIYMQFDSPVINHKLKILEADPFDIMMKPDANHTCKVKYIGPTNIIVSDEGHCVYHTGMKKHAERNMILSPTGDCENNLDHAQENQLFRPDRCDASQERDEVNFIQVKQQEGMNHIYCQGNKLTIEGKTQPCPDGVFVLPAALTFKINNNMYTASQLNLDQEEKYDPLFTAKANWHLQPRVNLSSLKQHPLVLPTKPEMSDGDVDWNHPMTYTSGGTTLIIIIIIVIAGVWYWKNKMQKPQPQPRMPRAKSVKLKADVQVEAPAAEESDSE
ncbi:Copia protein [Folsomia candida]|uniref:Copia protein n=1 Tax=Folsomia candida TaxID=158441 RepID=A0A226DIF6_FOLCA|nr:Copia protein [Folsomia candida]